MTRRWVVLAGHDPDAPACDFLSRPYTVGDLARDVEAARVAYQRMAEALGEPVAYRWFRAMPQIIEELKTECQPAATPAGPPAPAWSGHTTVTSKSPVVGASSRAARSAPASSTSKPLPGTEPTDLERRTAGKRGR
jgi:hypothetical protein